MMPTKGSKVKEKGVVSKSVEANAPSASRGSLSCHHLSGVSFLRRSPPGGLILNIGSEVDHGYNNGRSTQGHACELAFNGRKLLIPPPWVGGGGWTAKRGATRLCRAALVSIHTGFPKVQWIKFTSTLPPLGSCLSQNATVQQISLSCVCA